jgi:signal transduction histidine kinase
MPSQWLAVGAETDPLSRARELRRSWERLLADGGLGLELPPGATVGLRPTIVESWRRSLATGLDPTDVLAPIEADESEVLERWFEHPLGSLAQDLMEQLRKVAEESRSMVVVTDASGVILHRAGDMWLQERAAEMNLVEGARYSEAADGTNGIGTALAADRAFQVFAFEHFNERHHEWVCSGAPVHDPVSGRVAALIDLSSLWKTAHPRSLELVTTAARAMERRLFDVRRDQDARLRRRYGDLMTRSTDLLVSHDGYLLAGTEPAHSKPLDIPEDGGQVVLSDGSVAEAASLGQGEAYLLRQVKPRRAKSAPVEVLERAEKHVRELVTEQAALRQVATLVARESSPDQLFAAVAEQVARVFDVPHVRLVRYEPEGSVVVGGFREGDHEPFPLGSRWPPDSPGVIATVRQTGRPARLEDYAQMTGDVAAAAREAGMRSAVASPIVVQSRLWGAMVVLAPRREAFPDDTEARLADFTELVATAIANAESRAAVAQLADEQAALRRVAVLVAQQPSSSSEVFTAVTEAVGLLLEADLAVLHHFAGDGTATTIASWSSDGPMLPIGTRFPLDGENLAARIFESGAPARIFPHEEAWQREATDLARSLHMRSAVGAPILVEGKLWGALMAASRQVEPWAENAETRIAAFTELVATAIANAESREALAELADEQAALRRVATLVARGTDPATVFRAVCDEAQALLHADRAGVLRFDEHRTVTVMANSGEPEQHTIGARVSFEPGFVVHTVHETHRAARFDTDDPAAADMPEVVRTNGVRSAVGSPIVVDGELWGVITLAAVDRPLPLGLERRLTDFTGLVATAIANAESQSGLQQLADEQAALRRVATLVAQDAPPAEIFSAVSGEVAGLFDAGAAVLRFEHFPPGLVFVGISSVFEIPIGTRWEFEEGMASAEVYRTGRSTRVDAAEVSGAGRELGVVSSVATPIVVEGGLWGAVSVASTDGRLPPNAEDRLLKFTELVATAIANAEGKSELAASRRRIVAASDQARRRIERDLHDGTQQRLVALGLAVRAAEADVPREREHLRGELSRVAQGLAEAVEDLQEISRGIHPAVLTKGGLAPALRALAHRSPIPVNLDITMDVRLPEPIEVAAYFVASEALANAAKHSHASRIDVSLGESDGSLVLTVRDDGAGGVDTARGSGLVGLTDRVEALGGSIRVGSRPAEGTQITAELPLELELPPRTT